jgi:hypothetical protein
LRRIWPGARREEGASPASGAVTDEQRSPRPNSAQPSGRRFFSAQAALLAPYRSTGGICSSLAPCLGRKVLAANVTAFTLMTTKSSPFDLSLPVSVVLQSVLPGREREPTVGLPVRNEASQMATTASAPIIAPGRRIIAQTPNTGTSFRTGTTLSIWYCNPVIEIRKALRPKNALLEAAPRGDSRRQFAEHAAGTTKARELRTALIITR